MSKRVYTKSSIFIGTALSQTIMKDKTSTIPHIECHFTDVNGQSVTVNIDQIEAQDLLQKFGQEFDWQIQWQAMPTNDSTATENPASFTQQVLEAADTVAPAGRFGEQQVFINHAWRAWQNTGGRLNLADFKHRLLDMQQAELLELGCAALIQTLNAVDVSQSEIISSRGVVYHFVVLPENSLKKS